MVVKSVEKCCVVHYKNMNNILGEQTQAREAVLYDYIYIVATRDRFTEIRERVSA